MILAKLWAFWVVVSSLNVTWSLNIDEGSFLNIYPIVGGGDIITFTNLADSIFISLMIVGLAFYVILSLYFHNTHISPKLISKLAKYNLLYLVRDNFKLYHEVAMWLVFTWIANLLVLVNSFTGKTFIGIPTFSILFTAFLTVVFLKDASNELINKHIKK